MIEKLEKRLKKIDEISPRGISVLQWVMFAVVAAFCFLFFCHQDVLITAGHAGEYLKGHITDFYSACVDTDGLYGANYLPTTFIVFAIWNIPMKLFGLLPQYMGDWSVVFAFWNKLLPTICYFVSGYLMYHITVCRLGFDKKKGIITAFLFYTTPMSFFSQFLFCQYDIFTVLFMLLAMNHYFKKVMSKKDVLLFTLYFGIAVTFKYFAIIIFVVLLLLRFKNVLKSLVAIAASVLPTAFEILFYVVFDRKAFLKNVFGFTALDYASGFMIKIGEVSINGLYVGLLAIIAFAYFTKAKDFKMLVSYSMFYSCGVCFVLFGLMYWHPQWLMFMVPFWVLSIVINKHYDVFMWIDALLGLAMIVYIANQFEFTVNEQNFMRYGILMNMLKYKQAPTLTLSDIFVYKDANTMFSIIVAIFLIGFIFKHPKFNFEKLNAQLKKGRAVINIRFLAFSLVFICASLLSLQNFADRPDMLWKLRGGEDQQIVEVCENKTISQFTKLEKMTVDKVYIVCDSALKDENEEDNNTVAMINLSDATKSADFIMLCKDGNYIMGNFNAENGYGLFMVDFGVGEQQEELTIMVNPEGIPEMLSYKETTFVIRNITDKDFDFATIDSQGNRFGQARSLKIAGSMSSYKISGRTGRRFTERVLCKYLLSKTFPMQRIL